MRRFSLLLFISTVALAQTKVDYNTQIKNAPVNTVKAYGAIGDGTHDDTTAIQTAITASGASGLPLFFPPGQYKITSTLSIGDGDATNSGFSIQSSYNGLRLIGAGAGRDWVTPSNTELIWSGAAGGTMIVFHGPISQVELAGMKINGNGIAGNIIQSFWGDQGSWHDLLIGNSEAGAYFGIRCDYGCGSNVFSNIHIVQTASGTSDMAMGYQATVQGVSQNTLIHVYGQFPADTSTSYGLVMAGADNNNILMCDFQGAILTVAGATNASPIVITSSAPIPGLATGQKITILGVGGNTAANNSASNPQWTITKVDTSHFSLNGSTGNGAYTSGGSINGPGYALALISNGANEPVENTFEGGAYFNALSFDDNGSHGPNHFFGVSTTDGFLLPAGTANAGIIHPDYYNAFDSGGGYSRLFGRLKFVDSTSILGYAKFYPANRCVAVGDNLEGYSTCDPDLTVIRNAANANLNIFTTGGSGDARLNFRTTNSNTYTIKSDQTNNQFSLSGPGGTIMIVTPGGDRIMPSLPTSCSGKATGTLWNNAGAMGICP